MTSADLCRRLGVPLISHRVFPLLQVGPTYLGHPGAQPRSHSQPRHDGTLCVRTDQERIAAVCVASLTAREVGLEIVT